jgi:hypothetical protein
MNDSEIPGGFRMRTRLIGKKRQLLPLALLVGLLLSGCSSSEAADGGASSTTGAGAPATVLDESTATTVPSPGGSGLIEYGPLDEVDPASADAILAAREAFALPPGGAFSDPQITIPLPVDELAAGFAFQAACEWYEYLSANIDDPDAAITGLRELSALEVTPQALQVTIQDVLTDVDAGSRTALDTELAANC